jgi:hypothetical protein
MKVTFSMKPWLVSALVCGAALAQASTAWADKFDWSYTGTNGYVVSAGGTLTATPLGGGAYQVTSISGLYNGSPITGLTVYAGQDNEVYTTSPHLDFPGLAFTVGSSAYNAFYDTSTADAYNCGFVGYCEIGPGVVGTSGLGPPRDPTNSIAFQLMSVPEPATWGLMLIGLCGLGAALRRNRATPAAA